MEVPTPAPAPRRVLGWVPATGIVLGAIIGVGIFLTPGKVAQAAGSPEQAMLLWGLGGLIAMAGALSMAEIGARFPTSGGEMVALHQMVGRLPAFLYGWSLLTAIQTGVLVIISLFAASNLGLLLGQDWGPNATAAAATAMILGLAAINLSGVRNGATVQTLTSLIKLVLLAAVALLGVWALFQQGGEFGSAAGAGAGADAGAGTPSGVPDRSGTDGDASPWWVAGLAATLFSYGGFHQLTWVGGEVRDPQRTLPKAIVLGVALVITAYLAANFAWFALLPFDQVVHSKSLAADAVGAWWPGWGTKVVAFALCISAFGIANSQLLTSPRVYYALAREGLFPKKLAQLSLHSGVPRAAILLQALLAIVLLWLAGGDRMDQLVSGVVFVDWTFHILVIAALFRLRREQPHSPFLTPWWPWTPLIFILGGIVGLGATFFDPAVRISSAIGVAWMALGAVVYFVLNQRRLRADPPPL